MQAPVRWENSIIRMIDEDDRRVGVKIFTFIFPNTLAAFVQWDSCGVRSMMVYGQKITAGKISRLE